MINIHKIIMIENDAKYTVALHIKRKIIQRDIEKHYSNFQKTIAWQKVTMLLDMFGEKCDICRKFPILYTFAVYLSFLL